MDPTLAGFQAFVIANMGIATTTLPSTSAWVSFAYSMAMNIVNPQLQALPNYDRTQPSLYAVAVYNLAGDFLINYAQDDPPPAVQYFAGIRAAMGVNAPVSGILTSTGDNGSSTSFAVPQALSNLTLADLQNTKTPYGRIYLGIAQSMGTGWGIS